MVAKLAKTAGFCMGVRRAVDTVLDIVQHKNDEKVYTYGPLIHNPQTIELLKKRGVVPVDNADDIESGIIVIRAHGIAPAERKNIQKKGLKIVDATCPKVARVQSIIKRHASRDYSIVIIGDKDHPEVIGLLGYSSGNGIVVGNDEEADELSNLSKVCVVAQTTQDSKNFEKIVEKIRKKCGEVLVFNTVCDSTEKRQAEINELAREMDAIIVVGGRNSANTKRLAMISEEHGTPTFHIETADELEYIDLSCYEKIGVSAGASTPNWIIQGVIDYIENYQENLKKKKLNGLFRLWAFSVRTDICSAIGAGCLVVASMIFQELRINALNILIASSFVYAMHTINRLQEGNLGRTKGSFREESFATHKNIYLLVSVIALLISLGLSFVNGFRSFIALLSISILGLLYSIKKIPPKWFLNKLERIPGSKNIYIATAWASVIGIIPTIEDVQAVDARMVVMFMYVFAVVFIKTSLSDMIDVQSDRLVGRETIPVVMGKSRTRILLNSLSLLVGSVLVIVYVKGYASSLSLVLLLPLIYLWIYSMFYDKKLKFSSVMPEGILSMSYIVAGLGSYAWFLFI